MKIFLFLAIPLFLVLTSMQYSHARSAYLTYEVTGIRSDGIVVRNTKGDLSFIKRGPADFQVGEIIKYDYVRDRLRKSPWQLAEIVAKTNSTITLQLNNGRNLDVPMRGRYRGEFKQGEKVFYKEATGQLKKSNFQQLDEE